MSNASNLLFQGTINQALRNEISPKERKPERCQATQPVECAHIKESTIFALLLVTACSLGYADKAFAGKSGSSNAETSAHAKAALVNRSELGSNCRRDRFIHLFAAVSVQMGVIFEI